MKKILITGATGLIGTSLINKLLPSGYEITVFTTDTVKTEKLFPPEVKVLKWDYNKPEEWEIELNNQEIVIHLAGANLFARRWDHDYKNLIIDSRETSSKNIVKSIRKGETNLRILISASGIGYYGATDNIGVDENAPSGTDFLAEVCRRWETPTYKADEKDIRRINMRMGLVLSARDGYLSKLLPAYKLFAGGPLGSGKSWLSWIHIDDVVRCYLFAIENEKLQGAVNLTSPNPVTARNFPAALGKTLDRPSLFTVPGFALKLIVGEGGEYVSMSQKVLPVKLKNCGFSFSYPEIETALEDLIRNKK